MSTAVVSPESSGVHSSSRTASRNRSVAARVSRGPSISSRIPVSIGSVSSRPAATATCCDGLGEHVGRHDAGDLRHGRQLRVVLDRHGRQAEPAAAAEIVARDPSTTTSTGLAGSAWVMSASSRPETSTRPGSPIVASSSTRAEVS